MFIYLYVTLKASFIQFLKVFERIYFLILLLVRAGIGKLRSSDQI